MTGSFGNSHKSSGCNLKKDLKKAVKRYSDEVIKSHLDYCITMIDEAMENLYYIEYTN